VSVERFWLKEIKIPVLNRFIQELQNLKGVDVKRTV